MNARPLFRHAASFLTHGPWRAMALSLLVVALAMFSRTSAPVTGAASTWFVAEGGSDGNACAAVGSPCATVSHALTLAGPGDTIEVAGTIHDNIVVNIPITITGINAPVGSPAAIDGSASGTVILINGPTVVLDHLTIQNGDGHNGGGVANSGTVTISNSTLSGNAASSGGAVYNWTGTVNITDSVLTNNNARAIATGGYGGGAIFSGGGGGSYGHITVTRSTISNNLSGTIMYGGDAGALFMYSGSATFVDSVVSGNQAVGRGGAIFGAANVSITNSTFTGNTAVFGGALWTVGGGPTTIVSSTLSGNTAVVGGAIHNDYGAVTFAGTILSNNAGGNCSMNPGTFASAGFNLDSDGSCGVTLGTDLNNVDPNLGPFQDNFGPTWTMALPVGSPAVNVIPNPTTVTINGNTVQLCSRLDQRGIPGVIGENCDIGAFELTPLADLWVTKTDGLTTAVPGTSVTYIIITANAGPSDAPGSVVADAFPAEISGITWTCFGSGGATCTTLAGSGNINEIVDLPAGGGLTYIATGTISSEATGSLSNTATVMAGGSSDPAQGNNSATDTDTLTPQVNLTVSKSNGVATVNPGSTTTYTLAVANAGPSSAAGARIHDPVVPGLSKSAIGVCTSSGGAVCPAAGAGAGELNIANLEAGNVLIPGLPVGGSISFTVSAEVTASTGSVKTGFFAFLPPGTLGSGSTAFDLDDVQDTQPPVVTVTGPVDGGSYSQGGVPTPGCTTVDAPPGSGVHTFATVAVSGGNGSGMGQFTATCSGASDNAGNTSPPVSISYTVSCQELTYTGLLRVKVNQLVAYPVPVTVVVSLDSATCDARGVVVTSGANSTGAMKLDTAANWKAPVKTSKDQWVIGVQTPNPTTGGVFLNGSYRPLDATSKMTVKFLNGRLQLYLKLTGSAPIGVGFTKAGVEASVTNLTVVP